MSSSVRFSPFVLFAFLLLAVPAFAQSQAQATLRITVTDPSGGVLVGASVELIRDGATVATLQTDGRGQVTFTRLTPGPYTVLISSQGFETEVISPLEVTPGANTRAVPLRLAGLVEEVTVGRDPRESATDPKGDAAAVTFDEADLESLPDDEEALEQVLMELAGPDAELRVDGFEDGPLPPKSQIQQVRLRRNLYSADNHNRGGSRIEIITRPGSDRWRSNINLGFRDDALNARNAFAPSETPERQTRLSASLHGPLVRNRTSMSFNIDTLSAYDAATILAADADGRVQGVVRQPQDRLGVWAGIQHAIGPTQSARIEYQGRNDQQENLGVGDFDLPERAFAREGSSHRVRVRNLGTIGTRLLNETRLQVAWREDASLPFSQAPTVRVLDTRNSGGAGIQGGRSEREYELDQRLELTLGRHSLMVGGEIEWVDHHSDEIRNANGTFTFSSLADFEAGRPQTFTLRRGDPTVDYSTYEAAWFVQDDIRVSKGFTIGLGLRHEWQSHVDSFWNLGPRVGFSWAPFEDGKTTIRGGVGVFHDWYSASVYEETLQVNGTRVQEIVVEAPSYPDPFAGGSLIVLPSGRVQQAPDLELPTTRQATIAIERELREGVRIDLSYRYRGAFDMLRGRNVNAPGPDGVRPDPTIGNVIEIRSIGEEREHAVVAGIHGRAPWRRLFFAARYHWEREYNDGDGPLSLPANNEAPDEWGPASDDVRHRFSAFGSIDLLRSVQLGMNFRAESAPPYTITTGRDDNGDTVFNDRPAGIGRNSARGDGSARLDLRLAWRLGVGQGSGNAPPPTVPDGGRGRGGRGGRGGSRGDWRAEHRAMTELYVRASNVLNTVNLTGFRGAMTSPFFLQATSAQSARRIELGARLMF